MAKKPAVQQVVTGIIENPFHLRGCIGPPHSGGWRAMKWHEETLQAVFRDLDREPPEYVLVRAPALGGKTTFAKQFIDRVDSDHRDIFVVYLPLGGAIATLQDFLTQVRKTFVDRGGWLLDLIVENGDSTDSFRELEEAITAWNALECGDLEELLCGLLRKLPERFSRVVLILDDIDRMPEELRLRLGEALRTIHAYRPTSILRRFTVLLTARSLLRGPLAVSPLANVVKPYRLGDFTRDDLDAFLQRSEGVSGFRFAPEIVDYLYNKTSGQAVMLQRILRTATENRPASTVIHLPDIFESVCQCFVTGGGVVERLLDVTKLSTEAKSKLIEVIEELPVLGFEFNPAVADLIDMGIVRQGANQRLICRSPLIRELYIARFLPHLDLPSLQQVDEFLLNLPCVLAMVKSKKHIDMVDKCIRGAKTTGYAAHATPETLVVEFLSESGHPLDLREVQYCFRRYYGDLLPRKIEMNDILRTVAKVLVAWSDDNE
jgi:hypothetical protein